MIDLFTFSKMHPDRVFFLKFLFKFISFSKLKIFGRKSDDLKNTINYILERNK